MIKIDHKEACYQEELFKLPDYTTYTRASGALHHDINVPARNYGVSTRIKRAPCGPDCFIGQSSGDLYHQHPCKFKQDDLFVDTK